MANGEVKSETAKREEEILEFWKRDRIFKKSLEKPSPKGEFVFYDGPPFATGLPHSGSLLSSVSKDVIPRYKTMRGYHVRRRWGWDTHGLPIESLVEKKLGLKTKKEILELGVEKFNETARSMVLGYVEDWRRYVERVGRWVDFDNSYKTMDNTYIESVWWALKEIHKKGKLYEGKKVLMYCPHCETPLAKAEIAMDNTYQDVTEEAVTVKFKIKEPEAHGLPQNTSFLAWTTTPWTLPGNVALAVGVGITYALVERDDGKFLLAKDRFDGNGDIIKEYPGEELIGIPYEPLYAIQKVLEHKGGKHVVLPAGFVTTEEGTGVVHTAVMYGEDDFALGQKEDLPMVQLLDASGKYNANAPEFLRGKYIKDAERDIKNDLEARRLLFARANHTHPHPHCYRCGTPLIYNAVASWFIDIQSIKQKLLSENEKITWIPEHLKRGRFKHIVENAPDWTISRNRFWASPLPIWKDKEGNVTVIGSLEELVAHLKPGSDIPRNRRGELDYHLPYIDEIELVNEKGEPLTRIPEVVDCWVESSSMPFAEYHYPFENKEQFKKRSPGDFISEYIGQTRAWFYYLHAISVSIFGRRAFNNVTVTGNVLAVDGAKFSKSKGNYTDPYLLFDRYGADAFRYYLMCSVVMQGEDLLFRDEDIKEAQNRVVNIFRNTAAFYALYKDNAPLPSSSSRHVLDRWILARLDTLIREVTNAFERFDTVRATRPLRDFIEDFSTWYVRRSRDRVKGDAATDRMAALGTMRHVLLEFSKIAAPATPFVADEVFRIARTKGDPESVHLAEWPRVSTAVLGLWRFFGPQPIAHSLQLIRDMAEARRLVSLALEARQTAGIKVRQPLAKLTIPTKLNSTFLDLIKDEVNVKEVAKGEFALDTTITEELKEEGSVRDLIRAYQDLRKAEGLMPHQSSVLGVVPEDLSLVQKYVEFIKKSVHASAIERSDARYVRRA